MIAPVNICIFHQTLSSKLRSVPATGLPIKTPKLATAKHIPIRVPTSVISGDIDATILGGSERMAPDENPYRQANTIIPGIFRIPIHANAKTNVAPVTGIMVLMGPM